MSVLDRERRGQNDDLALGVGASNRARCGDPVEDGHLEVHQDDLGAQLLREPDGLLAVPGRSDQLQAVVEVEGQAERLGESW